MKFPRRRFLHLAASAAALPAISRIAGAQTGLPQWKTGTRLITLGTGAGPIPRPHQAQSSNLLTVNGAHYVVDAGDGVARRLSKARVDLRDVGTVFITHHHDDHTAGLGTLMSATWDQNRTKPIHVYGPPPTEAFVKAVVQLFNISAEIRIADGGVSVPIAQVFFGHDVGTGVVYQDANIKVTAVENNHYQFHSGIDVGKHKSYAYRFEAPDRVIVFTGDTGPSDAVTELARGADLLDNAAARLRRIGRDMGDAELGTARGPPGPRLVYLAAALGGDEVMPAPIGVDAPNRPRRSIVSAKPRRTKDRPQPRPLPTGQI